MQDGQWRLVYPGTDLTFGTLATAIFNMSTPELGDVEVRTADFDRPRADGRAMGIDYRGARTITFDIGIRGSSESAVRAEAARLAVAWRGDAVARTGGAVAELHAQYAGRERLVYGRPRRFSADFSQARTNNFITVTADFACVDDLFYGPAEESITIQLVPSPSGGLLAPLAAPLGTTATSDRSVVASVSTEFPAWPIIELRGPITNPSIEFLGDFKLQMETSLAYDETVVIDTRPWKRTALLNGRTSVAGAFTRASSRLADAGFPSGRYEVALRGSDTTGTAYAKVRWRGTYSTL